jgi:hypothetical protein
MTIGGTRKLSKKAYGKTEHVSRPQKIMPSGLEVNKKFILE